MSTELKTLPGVKRDGTTFDNDNYVAATWVRFQRGRPRKIGGYKSIYAFANGGVRDVYVDCRFTQNTAHLFSGIGVEQLIFDNNGVFGGINNRTPAGFTVQDAYAWQSCTLFQSGGGGTPLLVAAAAPDLTNLANDTGGLIYRGDVTGAAVLTKIQDGSGDILVSGGCTALQPFLFIYGSNGLIRNSNPNDVSTATGWTTGGANSANTANVAGTKVVTGLPVRGGGQAPAGLFWALDALIRVTFVGGTTLWKYDTLSQDITVLAKRGIIEYDNLYYWVGVDRFYVFNGIVQELPNALNFNWFFDNLNKAHANKVWALKVPRFGEIWWFFPFGADTECSAAIIYNVRENTWYDCLLGRAAGVSATQIGYPVVTSSTQVAATALTYTYTASAQPIARGQQVRGDVSFATGTVARVVGFVVYLVDVVGTFVIGENALYLSPTFARFIGGLVTAVAQTTLSDVYFHEIGVDYQDDLGTKYPIKASFETNRMNVLTVPDTPGVSNNVQVSIDRIEPDFVMAGSMTVQVNGTSYAQSTPVLSDSITFTATTEFVDPREQRREASLVFTSNEVGGTFQTGKVLVTMSPGDERG